MRMMGVPDLGGAKSDTKSLRACLAGGFPERRESDSRVANEGGSPCRSRCGLILMRPACALLQGVQRMRRRRAVFWPWPRNTRPTKTRGGRVTRPRAADDFPAIRARTEELRRERARV